MKTPNFKEFLSLKEADGFDESSALKELTEFIEENIPTTNFVKKEINKGNGISFNRSGSNEFCIDINKMGNGYIHMYLLSMVEVSSQSLSDPKAKYQTTSARVVKHKKTLYRELYDNVDKAKKKLTAFMTKYVA